MKSCLSLKLVLIMFLCTLFLFSCISFSDTEGRVYAKSGGGFDLKADQSLRGRDWMSTLPDDIKISRLNIPGAHNSATNLTTAKGNLRPYVENQNYYIPDLLDLGVRYLDLRYTLAGNENELTLCHGSGALCFLCQYKNEEGESVNLTNDVVMKWIKKFLDDNPSETVIVKLSVEDGGDPVDNEMYDFFARQASDPDRRYPEIFLSSDKDDHRLPTLGETRGKMVVIRALDSSWKEYETYDAFDKQGKYLGKWAYTVSTTNGGDRDYPIGALTYINLGRHYVVYSENRYESDFDDPASKWGFEKLDPEKKWLWVSNTIRGLKYDETNDVTKPSALSASDHYRNRGLDAIVIINTAANDAANWSHYAAKLSLPYSSKDYAKVVNPKLKDKSLIEEGLFLGWCVMDYIDASLAKNVYERNPQIDFGAAKYEWTPNQTSFDVTAKRTLKNGKFTEFSPSVKSDTGKYKSYANCIEPAKKIYKVDFDDLDRTVFYWMTAQTLEVSEGEALGHDLSYTYLEVGDGVTATCGRVDCPLRKDVSTPYSTTVKITADDKEYDGKPVIAKLEGFDEFKEATHCVETEDGIDYYKVYDNGDEEEVWSAPVDAGSYAAKFPLGSLALNKIPEVRFEITQGIPAVNDTIKVGGSKYKVLKEASAGKTGTAALVSGCNKKSLTVPAVISSGGYKFKVVQISKASMRGKKIRTVTVGKNVKTIKAYAFKGSKAAKVILKTKKLTKKSVKNSLKGSRVKTIKVKVGKKYQEKYLKKYKKIFTKKNAGKKVNVR